MQKLLIIFHSTVAFVDNIYWGKETFIEYFYGLSEQFEITLATPVLAQRESFHGIKIEQSKVTVVNIPKSIRNKKATIAAQIKAHNMVLIFMPSYTGVLAHYLCRYYKRQYIIYLGTDWQTLTAEKIKKAGITKRLLTTWLPWFNEQLMVTAIKGACFSLVTGGQLNAKYKNVGTIYETKPIIKLSQQNVKQRSDYALHSPVNLLFVGALFKRKGIHDLIRAVALLPREIEIKLNIVGDGPDKDYFFKLTKELKLQNKIIFSGFVPNGEQLFKLYDEADVFILPSYLEGFPRVVYEAFCRGVAVLVTAVGGVPYLLTDGTEALFIEKGNIENIAEKIAILINNDELRQRLVSNSYQLIMDILSENASSQHIKLLLENRESFNYK
jgi:glycosyltransferase involved in cell wall biosynthesis